MSVSSGPDGVFNNTKEMVHINGPNSPLLYVIDETGDILDDSVSLQSSPIVLLDSEPEKCLSSSLNATNLNKKRKKRNKKKKLPAKGTKPITFPGKNKIKFQKKKKITPKKLKRKKIEKKIESEIITIDDTASEASVILVEKDEKNVVIEINDTDENQIGTACGVISKAPKLDILNTNSVYFHEFEINNMATSTPISNAKFPPKHNNNWQQEKNKHTKLRPVILDGNNVAFGHGKDSFSSEGIKICVDYFKQRGHNVKVFLPQFRKMHPATRDRHLLDILEKEGILVYTPSRRMGNRLVVPYDDRFIVEYADKVGGVIVSRDNYRDLLNSEPKWKETICHRLLMYTFVDNLIMFPDDPLGRNGPNLEQFLRF